jgi:hypothetical protein
VGQSEESVDQLSSGLTELFGVHAGFVHQHDGNIFAHGINATARGALQALLIRRGRNGRFTERANQNIEKFLGDGHDYFTSVFSPAMPG